jgi:hypothetical protein
LVDPDKGVGIALAGLTRELTDLLGTSVDVVPADTLKPRVRLRSWSRRSLGEPPRRLAGILASADAIESNLRRTRHPVA